MYSVGTRIVMDDIIKYYLIWTHEKSILRKFVSISNNHLRKIKNKVIFLVDYYEGGGGVWRPDH